MNKYSYFNEEIQKVNMRLSITQNLYKKTSCYHCKDMNINQKWHNISYDETLKVLEVSRELGLETDEIRERQKSFGKNIFNKVKEEGLFDLFIRQIASPLTIILIIAEFVTLFLKEYSDAIVIAIAVGINVFIGVLQEYKASKAFSSLQKSQTITTQVVRDGRQQIINTTDVVPGDIVMIEPGTFVPADIRLIEATDLLVNEAALTGEWISVEKNIDVINGDVPITDQKNMVFMGTLVADGSAIGVVVGTGSNTQIGNIAKHLGNVSEDTPFQKSIKKLARFLVFVIIIILVLIFIIGFFREQPLSELLLIAIALAVSAIPEGLPIAVTVVLAFGMASILKRGGLVRNLLAAETLGSTTVILTDKTGTLTQAKMRSKDVITLSSVLGEEIEEDEDRVLKLSMVSSDAFVEGRDEDGEYIVRGRPVEKAIVYAGLEAGFEKKSLAKAYAETDFLKFSSKRRYSASIHEHKGKNLMIVVGASEVILKHSAKIFLNKEGVVLNDDYRLRVENVLNERTENGERLIGVGYKEIDENSFPNDEFEVAKFVNKDLTYVGALALHDPVRPDVAKSIAVAKEAGARVIMMTGDHKGTAEAIATEVGICEDCGPVFVGTEVESMSDEELSKNLKTANVFARMLPHQKMRVANLLKKEGEVVAMTGDGINDAPALRNANIGVALGSGTEVAKEASDLVLVENSFSVIVYAVEEGRRILDNLKKIVIYLLSTSLSEVVVVVGALLIGGPLPILPAQILWANIVGEGFMNFAFAFEPKEAGIMKRDPKSEEMKNILTSRVKKVITILAVVTSVLVLGLYLWLSSYDISIEKLRTIIFIAISVDSIFFAFSLKNLHKPVWRINPFSNKYLLVSLILSIALLGVALFVPFFQDILSIVILSPREYIGLLGLGLLNLFIIELVKMTFIRSRK